MMARASRPTVSILLCFSVKSMIVKLIRAVVPPEAPLRVATVGEADREAMMTNVKAPESTPHKNINQYIPVETLPFVSKMIAESRMSMGKRWTVE